MFTDIDFLSYLSGVGGMGSLLISGVIYYKAQKLKTSPEITMATNEQIQTIFDGYAGVIDTLKDELDRLKVQIVLLEEEQVACDKRNEALTLEITELRTRIESLGG